MKWPSGGTVVVSYRFGSEVGKAARVNGWRCQVEAGWCANCRGQLDCQIGTHCGRRARNSNNDITVEWQRKHPKLSE